MKHPLDQNMTAVRRRARGIMLATVIGWTATTVLAVLLILATIDYFVRWHDPGMRVIWSLLAITGIGMAIYRCMSRSLSWHLTNVDVAQRVQRRFPQLGDRLSNAVEFLDQSEDQPYAGSAVLRRAVVAGAVSDIETLNLRDVINTRPLARAASAALVVCAIVAALVVFDRLAVAVSIARLADPLGAHDWPRANHLRLVDPPRQIATGATFRVEVVDDGGDLPTDVQIEYRYDDRRSSSNERQPMQRMAGVDGPRMVARKEMVTRPFSYRAVGGDDNTMSWTRLEVVDPPRIESLDVQLHPPAYTALPPRGSDATIRALVGTTIRIDAAVTKPLTAARLVREHGAEVSATVSSDGLRFSLAPQDLIVDQSDRYWFKLEDRAGLASVTPDRWRIEAVSDTPPTITIDSATENRFVTARAVLPVRAMVKDDLAVAQIDLVVRRTDEPDAAAQIVSLMRGPTTAVAPKADRAHADQAPGASRSIEYDWDLSPLGLKPGTTLTVAVRAADYVPQWGEREFPRPVTIIDAAELEDRIAKRQTTILDRLGKAIELQRQALGQTVAQQIELQDLGAWKKAQVDRLQATELKERQVVRILTDDNRGVTGEIDRLLAQIEINRLERPAVAEHLQRLREKIAVLDAGPLSAIRADLTTAIKTVTAALADSATLQADAPSATMSTTMVDTALRRAVAQQEHVIAVLERQFDDLARLLGYRDFIRDLTELQREQLGLQRATARLGAATITQQLADLDDRQRADLRGLAQRQTDLADRLNQIEQRMQTSVDHAIDKSSRASTTLADVLALAQRLAVGAQMLDARSQIDSNRLSRATEVQEMIVAHLLQLIDRLSRLPQREMSRLLESLRDAERTLSELRDRQQNVRQQLASMQDKEKTDEARQQLEQIRAQQQGAQAEMQQLADRLKQLQADQASQSVERAAQQLAAACQACAAGNSAKALQKTTAAEQQLEQAQQQLAEKLRQTERARQQQARSQLAARVRALWQSQQSIAENTILIDADRRRDADLDHSQRSQDQRLGRVLRQQQQLSTQTSKLADRNDTAPLHRLALAGAEREMTRAAGRLDQSQTDLNTQQAQAAASRRLQHLLDALVKGRPQSQQRSQAPKKPPQQPAGQKPPSNKPQGPSLAEIKLLRAMQSELNVQTVMLEQALADQGSLSEAQRVEYKQLGVGQGELADLVQTLATPGGEVRDANGPAAPHDEEQPPAPQDPPPFDLPPSSLDPNHSP